MHNVTAPPMAHNRNCTPQYQSAPQWPQWEWHPLMVIYGHSAAQWPQWELHYNNGDGWDTAPPGGHNGNYTHNVTAPPSGHYKNYTPTRNVTAPPSGDSENYSPQY